MRTALLLAAAFFLRGCVCRLHEPGYTNPFYPIHAYVGSRVNEYNVSGHYDEYVEMPWTNAVTQTPSGVLWLVDKARSCVIYIDAVDKPRSSSVFAGLCGQAGHQDGTVRTALFNLPEGIGVSEATPSPSLPRTPLIPNTDIFVADTNNHCVRRIRIHDKSVRLSRVTTFAGSPERPGLVDGPGHLASLRLPRSLGVEITALGEVRLFVLDNHDKIRLIEPTGYVRTLVGGACRQVSQRLVASTVIIRTVGCHPDWLEAHTALPPPEAQDRSSEVCRIHSTFCGPRHHPVVSDNEAPHLMSSWKGLTSADVSSSKPELIPQWSQPIGPWVVAPTTSPPAKPPTAAPSTNSPPSPSQSTPAAPPFPLPPEWPGNGTNATAGPVIEEEFVE
ncbi:unnamed protein product [Vitrella brassicaformis CCMP3155]|uniref:VWFD domain-containing protein n=1 Tax=Vitrella brassicaformis (strain CCMP3155) TaxID=1169540 RepID=A0A0G4H8J5_VITBC|nr:unnamed protein product [Vitrella brassicaformis CCMP3155]|eukprot:CEM40096.1 unnamed protein product [Vitrella brassicaformis CCMP3155]